MDTAVILAMVLAFIGPACFPVVMARKGHGAISAFCLTNLITLVPMIGTSAWARYNPGPICHRLYHDAPCGGIPFDTGWRFLDFIFVALALWGLFASALATAGAFQRPRSRPS